MPRRRRAGSGGLILHVINRGAKRAELFATPNDYRAFENLLFETKKRVKIPLLSYCLMPNHWHLVVWPDSDQSLSRFMQALTFTHAIRWNAFRGLNGIGAVYQGRFKAIPVQRDEHFLRLCRYVERNAVRAGLVNDPGDWRWSSFWRRMHACDYGFLDKWPVAVPSDWETVLKCEQPTAEIAALRESIRKNLPFGASGWQRDVAKRLGVSLRRRGRPNVGRTLVAAQLARD
jgi:putative transposase